MCVCAWQEQELLLWIDGFDKEVVVVVLSSLSDKLCCCSCFVRVCACVVLCCVVVQSRQSVGLVVDVLVLGRFVLFRFLRFLPLSSCWLRLLVPIKFQSTKKKGKKRDKRQEPQPDQRRETFLRPGVHHRASLSAPIGPTNGRTKK